MNRPGLTTALAVLKLTVSAGLLAVLFNRADLGTMLTQFRQMNLGWMSAALAMYAAMLLVSAWRWRLLLRIQSAAVGFGLLTRSFLVATFFNNFLPSNIGGDVVRVADTAPYTGSKTVATTVVLVDRLLGLIALLAVAALASGVALVGGVRLHGTAWIWLALAGLSLCLLVVLRWPAAVTRLMHRAAHDRAAALQTRVHNLIASIHRFAAEPRPVWTAFAGAIAVQTLLILFYVCAARSLAVPFPLLAASVIVPISLAVQMLPLSINGFGVREAVFAFFFTSLGLDVSSALTLSLGSAMLIMLFSLSGGAVLVLRTRERRAAAAHAAEVT